jgi:hypothetical protein
VDDELRELEADEIRDERIARILLLAAKVAVFGVLMAGLLLLASCSGGTHCWGANDSDLCRVMWFRV